MPSLLLKIWSFITTGIMPKVLEYGGIAAGLIGAWAVIKKSGETAIELKEQANTLKEVEIRNEVEESVSKLSPSDIDKQLSGHYRD